MLDKTLLVKRLHDDRCAVIALPSPRVFYDIVSETRESAAVAPRRWASETLPKSWRCSESVVSAGPGRGARSRSLSSGSWRAGGGEVVRWRGRPAVVTRASRGGASPATEIFVRMPTQSSHFAGFGKSYHFSCVSPFQFTYPYVVYI